MRKLKLQMQLTLDGFVAGINGEMDWMKMNWGADMNDYVTGITKPVDTILMGRKLAEGFIPYWAANPDQDGAVKMNHTPKIVFSKSLNRSEWENTVLNSGNLETEVQKIKSEAGGDMIVYGGGNFVSGLIAANLIDEYHIFINPTAIGKGLAILTGSNRIGSCIWPNQKYSIVALYCCSISP